MGESTGRAGQVLGGRYRLVTLLGRGGMGSVWRGEHTSLGTPVAIKLIHPDLARRPGMLVRFQREAKAAAKLRGAHVVQILDHGTDDGIPYIAMECLDGQSLAERLAAEHVLSPAATAQIIAGVCAALVGAHRKGIIHRDLKPDNIFLAREETATVVKVLDFGIAKLLDAGAADPMAPTEATSDRTKEGAMLGTPRYMSPEQARGRADLDGRADLWSLAVITFQCLTGKRPFDAETIGELILQICSDPIPAPSSVGPVPDGFDAWFARATDRDPAARFENVRAFADALAEVLTPGAPWLDADGEGGASRESVAPSRDRERLSSVPSARAPTPSERRGAETAPVSEALSRRPLGRWIGVGLAAVAAVAGAVALGRAALDRGASPPAPSSVASVASGAPSPLAPPRSVLACPILEAEGVLEPSGWLGAVVAQHVCQRARWLLGGRTERTRIPAELLGLPPSPSSDAPLDPFGARGARDRTIEVAKQRAAAYVDGRVARSEGGYEVSLRVVDVASGVASSTFTARAAKPLAAADEVLDGLRKAGVLPEEPLDPEIVRVYDLRTAQAGWVLDDDVPRTDDDALCARAALHLGDLGAFGPALGRCRGKSGMPSAPGPLDPRTVGTLVMTSIGNMDDKDVAARAGPLLQERLAAERLPEGRVLLLEALALVRRTRGDAPEEVEGPLLEAARTSPRAVDWTLLMTLATGANRVAISRAAHAWNATDPTPSWLTFGMSNTAALPFLRRSWELDGLASAFLTTYAKVAILTGHREEASALAAACQTGPKALHAVGEAISARIDVEEGKLGVGQRRLLDAILAIDAYSGDDPRAYTPLHTNILLAYVLGNEVMVGDAITQAFVLEDPPRVAFTASDEPYTIFPIAIHCANASAKVAEQCFRRFDAWRAEGKLPRNDLLDAYLAGGRAFAKGDVAGALKAWGTALRVAGATTMLPFDRLLKVDPALLFDVATGDDVLQFVGVPVTAPRDAQRAAQRGDKEKARELAELVIGKWGHVDVEVPAVGRMKKLLKTL